MLCGSVRPNRIPEGVDGLRAGTPPQLDAGQESRHPSDC